MNSFIYKNKAFAPYECTIKYCSLYEFIEKETDTCLKHVEWLEYIDYSNPVQEFLQNKIVYFFYTNYADIIFTSFSKKEIKKLARKHYTLVME